MAQAPFFKVYIDNEDKKDISNLIESFIYEDCMSEDSLLTIDIKADFALDLADDTKLATGTILAFQFGFLSGELSEVHRARITDITHKYAARVTMNIKCLDIGTTVRKVSEQKIWNNVTSSDVARAIASKYGLDCVTDETSKKWTNVPQGNKADLHFLEYLAQREDTGSYVTYIRNTTLYFVKRAMKGDSALTFTYNDGNGTVMNFEPSLKESSQKGTSNKTVVSTFDPLKGDYKPTVVDNKTEEKTGTLGEYKREYSDNGQIGYQGSKSKAKPAGKKPEINKPVLDPTTDPTEAKNLGNHKKKKAGLKTLVAKLVVNGSPLITPNSIITMKNVAKVHAGNWFVEKVTHDVKTSGYVTTMDLNKNGTSKGGIHKTEKAKDSNKTVGPDKKKSTVKVRVYDGMGKQVGTKNV